MCRTSPPVPVLSITVALLIERVAIDRRRVGIGCTDAVEGVAVTVGLQVANFDSALAVVVVKKAGRVATHALAIIVESDVGIVRRKDLDSHIRDRLKVGVANRNLSLAVRLLSRHALGPQVGVIQSPYDERRHLVPFHVPIGIEDASLADGRCSCRW